MTEIEKSNVKKRGGEILARIDRFIEINAAPDKIWPMVFWDKVPQWFGGVKKAEFTSKFKDAVGATAHVEGEAGGVRAWWDAETTEWVENERFAWRTTAGTFTGVGYMTLTPTDSGTKTTFVMDYDLPYSLLGKIIDKLRVGKDVDKDAVRGLEKLKEIAERA